MTPVQIGLLVLGYALGSIPFGVIVARQQGIDIMAVGSGNIGATNVMRVLGKKPGLLVLFLDLAKGLVPALIARQLGEPQVWMLAAGIAAVVGHIFSPFLKFKGGKGVATALGALLGTMPLTGLIAIVVFATVLALGRMVSLASITAAAVVPVASYALGDARPATIGIGVICGLLIVKHAKNIQRILNGTESKFTFGKKTEVSATSEEDSARP